MPQQYTVQQGDHLSRIAAQVGISDYNIIWDFPQNSRLKQLRQNPNVLFPGDMLVIPDRREKNEARGTDNTHRFQIKLPALKLRIRLENLYGKPLANQQYRLLLEGERRSGLTNGQGQLEQSITGKTDRVALQTQPFEGVQSVVEIPVKVGHLDPVTEVSGWLARLNNLGYNAGYEPLPAPSPGQKAEQLFQQLPVPQRQRLQSAIEEFQCDNLLTVDGKCGASTQAKLKTAHGC